MNLKRVAFSLLLITFVLCCGLTATAENPLLSLGAHLFSLGNYDAAITEYKRFLFFHPDDVRVAETYHNIGRAYRAQGQWAAAIAAMRAAMLHAIDNETKSTYQLNLAVTLIASQNYELAQLELIKVTLRSPSPGLLRRAQFLKGVAYLYQFRWEEAQEVLQNYTDDDELNALFDSTIRTPRKSVKVAKILSAIVPGAGQVYAGDWLDGLNALVLNGALGFFTVNTALDGYYVDAVLLGTTIFLRYYQGNFYHAGKVAEDFNDQLSRQAASRILTRLQEIANNSREE